MGQNSKPLSSKKELNFSKLTQTKLETSRQTDRQTGQCGQTERQIVSTDKNDRQTDRWTVGTNRQIVRWARQTDRWIE